MTELERQLTAALETLSGQFETAQQQHSEQVATLRRQLEQQAEQVATLQEQVASLAGLVQDLSAQYARIASGSGGSSSGWSKRGGH